MQTKSVNFKTWSIGISLLLHISIFANIQYNINKKEDSNKFVELELFDKPDLDSKRIIVPDTQAPEKKIETNKLASKDTAVEKEQIRKGVTEKTSPSPQPKASASIQQKTIKTEAIEKTKNINNAKLLLSENDLSKFSSNTSPKKEVKASDSERAKTLSSNYQPFRQNRLFERFGTPEYLPQIQEGEVTLLNAKADQYAVFVRRVATQVFSYLRSKNWAQLGFAQARQSKKFATVEAIMNSKGKFVSLRLADTSGSQGFDLVLQDAVKEGLWDQNPQMSAALEDGNIHFIFQARTWAEIVGDPGRERRWLLLATGLK